MAVPAVVGREEVLAAQPVPLAAPLRRVRRQRRLRAAVGRVGAERRGRDVLAARRPEATAGALWALAGDEAVGLAARVALLVEDVRPCPVDPLATGGADAVQLAGRVAGFAA